MNPLNEVVLGFRFGVFFFAAGVTPNPLDIRFQKVTGLSARVRTSDLVEGGQNVTTLRLPERVEYDNLVLERGRLLASPLEVEVNAALSLFKFVPSNVIVTLFAADRAPLAGWLFHKAYPVRWETSGLNAEDPGLLIDTLELAYSRMQILRV